LRDFAVIHHNKTEGSYSDLKTLCLLAVHFSPILVKHSKSGYCYILEKLLDQRLQADQAPTMRVGEFTIAAQSMFDALLTEIIHHCSQQIVERLFERLQVISIAGICRVMIQSESPQALVTIPVVFRRYCRQLTGSLEIPQQQSKSSITSCAMAPGCRGFFILAPIMMPPGRSATASQFDIFRFVPDKTERDPSVPIDPYAPVSLKKTCQEMKATARNVHVLAPYWQH